MEPVSKTACLGVLICPDLGLPSVDIQSDGSFFPIDEELKTYILLFGQLSDIGLADDL